MIYSTYRINTASLVRNKLFICKEWHVQPSEIDKMPYYEYEQILEEIKKEVKAENITDKNLINENSTLLHFTCLKNVKWGGEYILLILIL